MDLVVFLFTMSVMVMWGKILFCLKKISIVMILGNTLLHQRDLCILIIFQFAKLTKSLRICSSRNLGRFFTN